LLLVTNRSVVLADRIAIRRFEGIQHIAVINPQLVDGIGERGAICQDAG